MQRFEENDEEIDEMLDKVIVIADNIKGHAENLGTEIHNQGDLIKKMNNRTE